MIGEIAREIFSGELARIRIELRTPRGAARGAHGEAPAPEPSGREGVPCRVRRRARAATRRVHAARSVSAPPRLRGRSNIFPGKTRWRTCPFPSGRSPGPPPLADEPRRASECLPCLPDRARVDAPGTPETAVAARRRPPPSLTAHPSIRDVRALFAAYPKSLTERGTDVSFFVRPLPYPVPARYAAQSPDRPLVCAPCTATALRARRWTLERLRGAHERARADVASALRRSEEARKRVARPRRRATRPTVAPRRAPSLRRGCAK